MMKYCTLCFLPDTKPDLHFNENGVCAACTSFEQRTSLDWDVRKSEFDEIIRRSRSLSTSKWDCVVPVSGGKDSTAQVLKMLELGLRPLCVTATTCDLSDLGRLNIENIKKLGVDYVEYSPNPLIRAKLNRIGLEELGDISWPEHVGIFTIPVRAAVQFRTPLIIWGENSQNEYGGPASVSQDSTLSRRWLEEFGGLLGMRVSDLVENYEISDQDLAFYDYPSDSELLEVGVTGLFLGYYFPWDGLSNYLIAQANGFNSYGKNVEGSILDYENLDNYQTGIHDYFKFLKFGFGRTTDLVSTHLRRGRITRNQGLELIRKHDGKYPWTYLGKSLDKILNKMELSVNDFDGICDRFTNKDLFQKDDSGMLLRDSSKSLIKINYDNT